jgi:hypothetical protein
MQLVAVVSMVLDAAVLHTMNTHSNVQVARALPLGSTAAAAYAQL